MTTVFYLVPLYPITREIARSFLVTLSITGPLLKGADVRDFTVNVWNSLSLLRSMEKLPDISMEQCYNRYLG
jgi:hypothetical protein